MKQNPIFRILLLAGSVALLANGTGCSNLPGTDKQQGAVIGGLGGAAAGAAIGGENNRLLGAIIGGALGAGGGYVVGANADRITGNDRSGAETATQQAKSRPATAEEARNATTADLNSDGFITLDEVVALNKAGYSDQEILNRLQATGQVFELTSEQQEFLRTEGVSATVVNQMAELNRETRERLNSRSSDVIGTQP